MARSSSPVPIRRTNGLSLQSSFLKKPQPSSPIHEMDELAGDTIPCSPGAFLARDPQEPSSPASVIEVPASSPFQPAKQPAQQPVQQPPSKMASLLAPAGTVFRPPQPAMGKRASLEPICLDSDDESLDGEESRKKNMAAALRGDIRPTTFRAQIAAFAYKAPDEREVNTKLRQIFDVLGSRIPSDKVREALRKNRYDVEDTIDVLERQAHSAHSKSYTTAGRRLVSKGEVNTRPAPSKSKPPVKLRAETRPKTPPAAQPARRRLVQGLRKRKASSPVEVEAEEEEEEEEEEEPPFIDLVDNDKEDAYQAEASPSPSDFGDDRVLSCINDSSLKTLAAITGMNENLLEPVVEKRPFASLGQARKASADKKAGARKSARVCVGETVVEAVEIFLNAVEAIDKVVAKCEIKGKAIKDVVDSWSLNQFGQSKSKSGRASPEGESDLPMTPTSFTTGPAGPTGPTGPKPKYVKPIIPRQPRLMDGHCVMKPFQLFGLNWMSVLYNYGIGCILADEMGLGKTCQVISFICQLVEEKEEEADDGRKPNEGRRKRPWPNLIVVPPSTYNNWLAEFKRFAPGLRVVGYRGTVPERAEIGWAIQRDPEACHVVLATYSQIIAGLDMDNMRSFDLNAAIFDEGHKLKNPATNLYRDLKRIPAAWKMLLTGTPVQNNLLEMTALLDFINPTMFDGCMDHIQYIFRQKVTVRDVSNGAFLYSERVRRARTILEPFILQRRKDQVLSDMPRKVCTVVHCEMSEAQRGVYAEYEELFKMEPSERAATAMTRARGRGRQNDQNNPWMQLRKAALHPLLFRRYFADAKVEAMARILMAEVPQSELHQPDLQYLTEELKNSSDFELHLWCRDYPHLLRPFDMPPSAELDSGKVRTLLSLIRGYQSSGDRALVFSKFSRLIELLSEVLALAGIPHRVLMGNTDVASRQQLIDEFNEDPAIPVFLLTTGAGGTGINLTAANKVVIFDQSENPQDDIQAENRAHRLGQRREVEVVRLIARGTMEELLYKACLKKIELAEKVTGVEEGEEGEEGQDGGRDLENEVRKMMMMERTPP